MDIVHNVDTNEDGRVNEIRVENGAIIYDVSVPKDISGTGWEMGAEAAQWVETCLEPSTNKFLARR